MRFRKSKSTEPLALVYMRIYDDDTTESLDRGSLAIVEARRRGYRTELIIERGGSESSSDRSVSPEVLERLDHGDADALVSLRCTMLATSLNDFAALHERARVGGWWLVVIEDDVDTIKPSVDLLTKIMTDKPGDLELSEQAAINHVSWARPFLKPEVLIARLIESFNTELNSEETELKVLVYVRAGQRSDDDIADDAVAAMSQRRRLHPDGYFSEWGRTWDGSLGGDEEKELRKRAFVYLKQTLGISTRQLQYLETPDLAAQIARFAHHAADDVVIDHDTSPEILQALEALGSPPPGQKIVEWPRYDR
jgi:hypothetical protein